MKTSIEFINHASVVITGCDISLLTDPWYEGPVFHRGWSLLFENQDNSIERLLSRITHIWISHEHPDHFSVPFFKKYGQQLKENSVKILFQRTSDRRVVSFLHALDLDISEIGFESELCLTDKFRITCFKNGFYDSALLVKSLGEKILNLNDCDLRSEVEAKKIFKTTGPVDVLLTQFSYAAWKGGKENVRWRRDAASEKIKAMKIQDRLFSPRYLIPFASFIYFSNELNFYLNRDINTPDLVEKHFDGNVAKLIWMKPGDRLGGVEQSVNNERALRFWRDKLRAINNKSVIPYGFNKVGLDLLEKRFCRYCKRISQNNSIQFMKVVRLFNKFTPLDFFEPVYIKLIDLGIVVKVDYVNGCFEETSVRPMIAMRSESLDYIFGNTFGFDTLTVNGCFEEEVAGGFVAVAKTLSIENLNNLGISVGVTVVFQVRVIAMFASRLWRIRRHTCGF